MLGYGKDFFINNWHIWALLFWGFLFLLHFFNVFIKDNFMDKKWEDTQLEKLKAKQEERINELEVQVDKETKSPTEVNDDFTSEPSNDL